MHACRQYSSQPVYPPRAQRARAKTWEDQVWPGEANTGNPYPLSVEPWPTLYTACSFAYPSPEDLLSKTDLREQGAVPIDYAFTSKHR